ncbi:MAG: VanZ family protein [Clostridia bacterium]|nr:VanZ family protein [Clostridia bacterium]
MGNFIDNVRTRAWWKNALSLLFCALVVVNVCVIFSLSTETGEQSANRSEGVADIVAGVIVDGYDEMESAEQQVHVDIIHVPLRQLAHFSLFACLGALTTLLNYSLGFKKWYFTILIPTVFGLANAIFDELHQNFSAGRVADVTDVLTDMAGVLVAVAIINLIAILIRRYSKNRSDTV